MATDSNILAWKIPWRKEPGGSSPWSHQDQDTTEHPHTGRFSLMRINKLLLSLGKLNVEWVKSISF